MENIAGPETELREGQLCISSRLEFGLHVCAYEGEGDLGACKFVRNICHYTTQPKNTGL